MQRSFGHSIFVGSPDHLQSFLEVLKIPPPVISNTDSASESLVVLYKNKNLGTHLRFLYTKFGEGSDQFSKVPWEILIYGWCWKQMPNFKHGVTSEIEGKKQYSGAGLKQRFLQLSSSQNCLPHSCQLGLSTESTVHPMPVNFSR